jgi:hypothetical protein
MEFCIILMLDKTKDVWLFTRKKEDKAEAEPGDSTNGATPQE